MRASIPGWLEKGRICRPLDREASPRGALYGCFRVGSLAIISSGAACDYSAGWEHVSVSRPDRCPTWDEMTRVKNAFWSEHETVLQFHPPKSEYVNRHPYCLHLWRPPYPVVLPPQDQV